MTNPLLDFTGLPRFDQIRPDHVAPAMDHLLTSHLPELPDRPDTDWSQTLALSTHPRITERARHMGITQIIETRPTLAAVVDALRQVSVNQAVVDTIKPL